jgi:hypothetical protein
MAECAKFEEYSLLIQAVPCSGIYSHRKYNAPCLSRRFETSFRLSVSDSVTGDDVRPAGSGDPSVSCQALAHVEINKFTGAGTGSQKGYESCKLLPL